MASVYCGSCGARNAAAVRFCTACGQDQARFTQPGEPVQSPHTDVSAGAEPAPPSQEVVPPPDGYVIAPPDDRVAAQRGPFMRWFMGEDTNMGEDTHEHASGGVGEGVASPAGGLATQKEQHVTGIVVAGYICAILMPLAGAIIGATQLNRNRHGAWILGLSIGMAVLSIIVGVVLFSIVVNSMPDLESYGSEYEY